MEGGAVFYTTKGLRMFFRSINIRMECCNFPLQGTLKGFDQTVNLILDESHERVFSSGSGVEQVMLGLYIIRGDNMWVKYAGNLESIILQIACRPRHFDPLIISWSYFQEWLFPRYLAVCFEKLNPMKPFTFSSFNFVEMRPAFLRKALSLEGGKKWLVKNV